MTDHAPRPAHLIRHDLEPATALGRTHIEREPTIQFAVLARDANDPDIVRLQTELTDGLTDDDAHAADTSRLNRLAAELQAANRIIRELGLPRSLTRRIDDAITVIEHLAETAAATTTG